MKKSKDHKKIFEQILSSREFDQLESYTDERLWPPLNDHEKELLGLLFVLQGEKQLKEGNNEGLESFRRANQVAPDNPRLLYRQAIIFSQKVENQFCLKMACKLLEAAISLDSGYFNAWHAWANTLVVLGSLSHDFQTLNEALDTFDKAERIADREEASEVAELFRDKGLCWFSLGKLSEEPDDFKKALLEYKKSYRLGLNTCYFWNDYANACYELSQLLNKPELLVEVAELYWRSIKLSHNYFPGWFNLGVTLSAIYAIHPQEAYFSLANESFEQASKLDSHRYDVWLKWGQLLLQRGKAQKEIQNLSDACGKFEAADLYEPLHPHILSAWGESLLLIGSWTEDLRSLRQAEAKVVKSLEMERDNPRLWCLYGSVLNELGMYFDEEEYYKAAMEKFHQALQIDSGDYQLWYGLATSLTGIGYLHQDAKLIKQASQYCMKVVETGGSHLASFWNDWGVILMKLATLTEDKRYLDSSINKFEHAIKIRRRSGLSLPGDVQWYYNLGCAYEYLGDYGEEKAHYEKAVQIFKRVIELDPGFFPVHLNLASTLSRLGELQVCLENFTEANRYFEMALVHDPEDDHAWIEWAVSLLNMAEMFKEPARPDFSKKIYEQAEKHLVRSAGLGNYEALYQLACLYSLTKNYEASMHYLEICLGHSVLPPTDELLQDEWLSNVRETGHFSQFLSRLEDGEI